MPEKGGKAGHYATAYLHLLDGIAHVGAVSLYRNESFYNDAFDQFGRALDTASRAGHDALTRACLRWFGWLGQFTVVARGTSALTPRRGDRGSASIPRPDDCGSGRRGGA